MVKQKREHQTFYVGLKAFIADEEKLLILQDQEGFWELPGGRIEKNEIFEKLEKPLRREVAEELGDNFQYEAGDVFQAWIRKPDPLQSILSAAEYSGKDLCIFLVGVLCTYKSGEPKLSPEHQSFKWITKEEVDGLEFENTYKDAIMKYFQPR